MSFEIDQVARNVALRRYVLPECLHVPIAAVNEEAITTYIGDVAQILSKGTSNRAFLVQAKQPPPIADLGDRRSRHPSPQNAGVGPCRLHPLPGCLSEGIPDRRNRWQDPQPYDEPARFCPEGIPVCEDHTSFSRLELKQRVHREMECQPSWRPPTDAGESATRGVHPVCRSGRSDADDGSETRRRGHGSGQRRSSAGRAQAVGGCWRLRAACRRSQRDSLLVDQVRLRWSDAFRSVNTSPLHSNSPQRDSRELVMLQLDQETTSRAGRSATPPAPRKRLLRCRPSPSVAPRRTDPAHRPPYPNIRSFIGVGFCSNAVATRTPKTRRPTRPSRRRWMRTRGVKPPNAPTAHRFAAMVPSTLSRVCGPC